MRMKKLHPGAKWIFRLGAYAVLIFLGFFFSVWGAAVLSIFFGGTGAIITFILSYIIFIIVFGEIYARMAYNRWFYEFTEHGLKLERGIIWKRYSNIPYDRIQNVDVRRGIIARIIGFSTVDVQTAGYSGYGNGRGMSEGHIPAVGIAEAEKIRDSVLKKITGKRSKGM